MKLNERYHEIYGLYFEGGEERTKNIESEVAILENALQDIMHGTKDAWAEKIARNALENTNEQ